MIDFLIVGRGLAATVLMHTFKKHSITFKTIGSETLSKSSRIAAGIWNPIVFKRLTKSWLADDLIPNLLSFYRHCEKETGHTFIKLRPIIKPFTEEHEKKLWLKKAEVELKNFISPKIFRNEDLLQLKINSQYGVVTEGGNLNVESFLDVSSAFFSENITEEIFEYPLLEIHQNYLCYKSLKYKHVIFCEGYLVKNNPFFNWIPLKPAKGEILTIRSEKLNLQDFIFNKNGFIFNTKETEFKIGATYAWDDLTEDNTPQGLEELKSKISEMIRCEYTIHNHEAGIRPSSVDRRPIIGLHPRYVNLFVFNGLGTKGIMLAPYFAKNFVNFFLQKEALNESVDVKRFYPLYDKKEN